jgi:hypothetical protein
MKRLALVAAAFVCVLAVDSLLILRTWMQVTAKPLDSDAATSLFSLTQDLASPFSAITGQQPRADTGVVDFTVLVAIEGYFVALLIVVWLVFFFGNAVPWLVHPSAQRLSRLAAESEDGPDYEIWQPRASWKLPGSKFYVPMSPAKKRPAHRRAGLGRG